MRSARVVLIALLLVCGACKTSRVREPGEPVDLPLDIIDVAVSADGGTGNMMAVEEVNGGAQVEGVGAGEPQEGLGIELRDQ